MSSQYLPEATACTNFIMTKNSIPNRDMELLNFVCNHLESLTFNVQESIVKTIRNITQGCLFDLKHSELKPEILRSLCLNYFLSLKLLNLCLFQ